MLKKSVINIFLAIIIFFCSHAISTFKAEAEDVWVGQDNIGCDLYIVNDCIYLIDDYNFYVYYYGEKNGKRYKHRIDYTIGKEGYAVFIAAYYDYSSKPYILSMCALNGDIISKIYDFCLGRYEGLDKFFGSPYTRSVNE